MLAVQYANKTSKGLLAPYIGWINWGNNLRLSNSSNTATIVNRIPGGYTISFNISISVQGDEPYSSNVLYQGFSTPTFGDAPFGNTAYTGIGGKVALYTAINQPINYNMIISFTLNNIVIKDACNNKINSFLFFAADSETTNHCITTNTIAENWSVTNNNAIWTWLQPIPAKTGNISSPVVSGNFTNTVTESGQKTQSNDTASNIFMTVSPSTIIANTNTDGGREGFAFGVIILPSEDINKYISEMHYNCTVPHQPYKCNKQIHDIFHHQYHNRCNKK